MASIKNFKKELVYTYGALLDECYIVEMICPKADRKKLQALCGEIEQAYDAMADRLGSKNREKGTAAHAKEVRKEFDASVDALTEKLRALVETK